MATVRSIIHDALIEIGVIAAGEPLKAADAALGLRRFQHQLDSWQAKQLSLAVQKRVEFTLSSGDSSVTVGPGGDVSTIRPLALDTVNYIIPGSSPEVEVPVAIMDAETYAGLSIKELPSALPLSCFYENSIDTLLGTLFVWPQVTQNVTMVLYFMSGVPVPTTLDDNLLAPPGYQEAFMYELALRLVAPFGRNLQGLPLLPQMAKDAYATAVRPNLQPGQLGTDAALIPSLGGAYNVLSDSFTGSSNR